MPLERRPKRRVYIPAGSGGCNRGAPLTIREQQWPESRNARAPRAPSTRPRSSAFPRSPPNGGTRAARWRRCTSSIRCGIGYIRDQAAAALRPRCQAARLAEGPAHPRHRLRRRHAVASRWPGSAPTMVGVDPSETNIAAAKRARRRSRDLAIDYRCTTAEELAEAGERFDIVLAMEVVEHVADVPLFVAELRRDGEARRADDRRHAQPHAEELRARHRRRRIHPALAAGRHAIAGTSSSRRTSSRSRWSRAACA